jgi:hypothetical protein
VASLFISYRRADSPDTVKLIHERLKQRLPRWDIFYDHESIPMGDAFPELLRDKMTSATAVLFIAPRVEGGVSLVRTSPLYSSSLIRDGE